MFPESDFIGLFTARDTLRERLAAVSHAIWSHWMRYQLSVCVHNTDGSVTIPADKVSRWKRQMNTSYKDLIEKERESDREQADKIIAVLDEVPFTQAI